MAAFRGADSYRGEARVTTWLHRIVVNACLDRLRTMRSRETEPFRENLDRWTRMGTTFVKDPAVMKEQRSVVAEALSTLNADQRATLVLVDTEGYSVEEAILGCASGTVKNRCAGGRARLLPLLIHLKAEEGS